MNNVVKMHQNLGKLPKSEFLARRALGREVNGIHRNKEGRQMAQALYFSTTGRLGNENEVRDFQKRETKGHSYSITSSFTSVFGDVNPARALSQLEMRAKTTVEKIEPIDLDTFTAALSTGNLTFHTREPYETWFNQDSQEPIKVYKITLN